MIKRASLNQKFSGRFVKVAGIDDYVTSARKSIDDVLANPEVAAKLKAMKDFGMNYGDDIGIGVGAAGLAGLGGAAALRNIKSLQRTDPGMLAKLMGAQSTGLTRGQINALGGGLGLGAGIGAGMYADPIEALAMSGYAGAQGLASKGYAGAQDLYSRGASGLRSMLGYGDEAAAAAK
jgi:hypothetical protein